MLVATRNTFPLAEMDGIIPRAENVLRVKCYMYLEGHQSLMICFIPTEITRGASAFTTSKNSKNCYMQQNNEKEKDGFIGLGVNWAQ